MKVVLIFFICLVGCSCEKPKSEGFGSLKEPRNWSPILTAALEDNFSLDKKIQNKLYKQSDTILEKLYLESLVDKRVSVSVGEISEYYNKTKNQHKRTSREFLLMRFTTTNKDSALYIRRELLKKTGEERNEKRLGVLVQRFLPRRELIKEENLLEPIKKQFLARRGKPTTVGPYSFDGGFFVFHLLKTYDAGTTKDLIHIQDEIRSKIYSTKAHSVRAVIVDSLYALYQGSKK